MGTGNDITFNNNGETFEISLATNGELEFRANNAGDRRMVIRDGFAEVAFDGRITVEDEVEIGGAGQFGSLQLKASDGVNTIHLGSSQSDATMLVGGGGHDGHIEVHDGDNRTTVDLDGEAGKITVGASGSAGFIELHDSNNRTTVNLNGEAGKITVGVSGNNGFIELKDNNGNTRIQLDGATGRITFLEADGTTVITTLP